MASATPGQNTRVIAAALGIVLIAVIGGSMYYKRTPKAKPQDNIPTVTVAHPIKKEVTEWMNIRVALKPMKKLMYERA